MPYIGVEGGKLTKEQKEHLIERLTVDAADIMNIPKEFFTVVIRSCKQEVYR